MKKNFFFLEGNNGATYIFNTKNWKSISHSLKFYKSRSLKQVFLKVCLHVYLLLYSSSLMFNASKDKRDVDSYLETLSSNKIDFKIDNDCSVLVSPTRDKVIVNHHDESFQKFAFEKSFKKVRNEAVIYKLFEKPSVNFRVSKTFDFYENGNFCSFKLKNNNIKKKQSGMTNKSCLVPALVELFNSVSIQTCTLSAYLETVQEKLASLEKNIADTLHQAILTIVKVHGNDLIPLGLVHRDFKPWNVIDDEDDILIYDFEETVTDGPPLEDLFNYFIDPDIRYKSTKVIAKEIFHPDKVRIYETYLGHLNLDIDFRVLLNIYLIERLIFWMREGEIEVFVNYMDLLMYLIRRK